MIILDNIWLYGFDTPYELKVVGFVIADSEHQAMDRVSEMYNDFATDYDMEDLVVWNPRDDDNYRDDYPYVMEINY